MGKGLKNKRNKKKICLGERERERERGGGGGGGGGGFLLEIKEEQERQRRMLWRPKKYRRYWCWKYDKQLSGQYGKKHGKQSVQISNTTTKAFESAKWVRKQRMPQDCKLKENLKSHEIIVLLAYLTINPFSDLIYLLKWNISIPDSSNGVLFQDYHNIK